MQPRAPFHGFEIIRPLGSGVYSRVFLAEGAPHESPVALKVLKPQHRNNPWILNCFLREGRIGSTCRHRSLIRIHPHCETLPAHVHVCDPIGGAPLGEAAVEPPAVVSMLAQVAAALGELHARGIVHGDVKPVNIMLEPNGRAVLIDLGFAREIGSLSLDEGLPGTPNYLAPELCRKRFADSPAADLFALGVTAFELLCGRLPYPKLNDTQAVLRQHRSERPEMLSAAMPRLPAKLRQLVDRLLAKDAAERPTAAEAAEMFRSLLVRRQAA